MKRKIISIFIVMYLLTSCDSIKTPHVDKTETYATETTTERLEHPVMLHFVTKNGMTYMISSGIYGEAGTSTVNLTLDSLQVEYYKQELSKNGN